MVTQKQEAEAEIAKLKAIESEHDRIKEEYESLELQLKNHKESYEHEKTLRSEAESELEKLKEI